MIQTETQEPAGLPKQIIWRRNCPYLYSLLYVTELEWPSLTVDWISAYQSPTFSEDVENAYNLAYGTQTSDGEQNYIVIAKTRIPNQAMLRKKYQKERLPKNDTVKKNDELMPEKVQVMNMIPHEGEVNRIRHNPHEFTKIASKTTSGEIHIFSTSSFKKDKVAPELRLVGHEAEGYALEWSPIRNGYIVSGSYDGKLSVWDIKNKEEGNLVRPLVNFNFHKKQIEDVSFNKFHESIFLSCDDEGMTALWDSRDCTKSPVHSYKAHEGAQYACQFSPSSPYCYLTGGADRLLKVWDVRNTTGALYCCESKQEQQITQAVWSREDPGTAWSVSGGKSTLWDLTSEKAKFVHACRSSENPDSSARIYEMSVNINQPDTLAVVDSNNEIQIFQPNDNSKL